MTPIGARASRPHGLTRIHTLTGVYYRVEISFCKQTRISCYNKVTVSQRTLTPRLLGACYYSQITQNFQNNFQYKHH